MKRYLYRYTKHPYDGLKTSPEILRAIERIVWDDILDPASEAYHVWSDPTPPERARVCTLAWRFADADVEVLHWGVDTIPRSPLRRTDP